MQLPIIIDNRGDILVFATIEQTTQYIEPVDVLNGEYVAFDSAGRLLNLKVLSKNRIQIEAGESEPSHVHEVQQILIDFFRRVGLDSEWIESLSLQQLIEVALRYRTV